MVSIFYCCNMWFHLKLPRYYPLEHTWKMIKEPGKPSQGWYGMQTFAFIAAGIVTFIVYRVLRRSVDEIQLKPATVKLIALAVSVIVSACLVYIMYYEYHRWKII